MSVNQSKSMFKPIDFSVPQGSLLGPVLYSVYASTLQYVIPDSFDIHAYADDHAIKRSHKASVDDARVVTTQMSLLMNTIKEWMDSNRLKLNDSKTEFILFGSKIMIDKCNVDVLNVNNVLVPCSKSVKYLGAHLDQSLSMKDQITSKRRSAMAGLRLIRNIRHLLTFDACHTLVLGLVISHLDYANSLFLDLPNAAIKKLQTIQNMAAKLILKRGKRESASEALRDLHWLPIRQRILHKVLTIIFKCIVEKSAPSYLANKFILAQQSSRSMRSNNTMYKLVIPQVKRCTFASRAISVAGAIYWNKLPNNIKQSPNLAVFKRSLKTYLFPN